MEEKKEQRRSVGGLEHNERSSHDERGVYLKQETKSLCDTYTGEVYTFIKYIYIHIYIDGECLQQRAFCRRLSFMAVR